MMLWLFLLVLSSPQQHDGHAPAAEKPATLMAGLAGCIIPSPRAARRRSAFSIKGSRSSTASTTMKRSARSGGRPSSIPRRRCRTGASRWRSARTSTSTSTPTARRPPTTKPSGRVALAATAPAVERAYVDAVATRYSNDPKADLKALAAQYKDVMRDLVARYPDDLDAATLYAESLMDLHPWQLWLLTAGRPRGPSEIVATFESVLRRDAMHIGANHYYIHAVEASRTPDRALASARRLETLVPAAGHLVHMPAHIYMRTGDYQGAVTSNAKAAEVDRAYIKADGADGVYPSMYYNHNLDFLASAAMMTGQFKEAKRAADLVVANATPMIATMPMLEPFGAKTLYVLLRFARWDDVMRLPRPDPKHALLTTLYHFGRGVAQAARQNASDAERERVAYAERAQGHPARR